MYESPLIFEASAENAAHSKADVPSTNGSPTNAPPASDQSWNACAADPPAAVYHRGAQKTWCSPNGTNDLSVTPNINESRPATCPEYSPKYASPIPIHGQITKNKNDNGIIRRIPANGTNLFPPKNAIIDGSSTSWNVL